MASARFDPLVRYIHKLAATSHAKGLTDKDLLARFATQHDEAAFAVLVRRHGAMVHGVCRRILRDWHSAEDALQATFLVLARKARSLHRPEMLGPWLHGVAYRTAMKAKTARARRRKRELRAADRIQVDPAMEASWQELRLVLDAAIARLPTKYREPIVLCYLQGKSQSEAASALGCPRGTVGTRLAWARERLRSELQRNGLMLSAVALATALAAADEAAAGGVIFFDASAFKAIATIGSKSSVSGAISAKAVALSNGVIRAMWITKMKIAAAVLLGIATTGLTLAFQTRAAEQVTAPGKVPPSEVDRQKPAMPRT